MLRWIGDFDPARDDADGRWKGALVGGTIDPARQPAHHGEARLSQCGGEFPRNLDGRSAGIARTHHGYAWPGSERQIAAIADDRRRAPDLRQQRRIIGLVVKQIARTGLAGLLHLGLDRCDRGGAILPAGSGRDVRQGIDGGNGIAEPGQQLAIGNRTDARAAQQPDPCECFLLREDRLRPLVLHQRPARLISSNRPSALHRRSGAGCSGDAEK